MEQSRKAKAKPTQLRRLSGSKKNTDVSRHTFMLVCFTAVFSVRLLFLSSAPTPTEPVCVAVCCSAGHPHSH